MHSCAPGGTWRRRNRLVPTRAFSGQTRECLSIARNVWKVRAQSGKCHLPTIAHLRSNQQESTAHETARRQHVLQQHHAHSKHCPGPYRRTRANGVRPHSRSRWCHLARLQNPRRPRQAIPKSTRCKQAIISTAHKSSSTTTSLNNSLHSTPQK